MLREAEDRYLSKAIALADGFKNTWRVINEQIRGRRNLKRLPSALSGDYPGLSDLNRANEFYAQVGNRVGQSLDQYDTTEDLPTYGVKGQLAGFQVPGNVEITEIIMKMKNGKAPGADGLTTSTVKHNMDFFVPILRHIVSLVFESGVYPRCLKEAIVVLIHKKGNLEELGNYRPIPLLSVLNKVIEKIIAKQLGTHLEENSILSDMRFGFRKKRAHKMRF